MNRSCGKRIVATCGLVVIAVLQSGCVGKTFQYSITVDNESGEMLRDVVAAFPDDSWKFEYGDIVIGRSASHFSERMPPVPSEILLSWQTAEGVATTKTVAIREEDRRRAERGKLFVIVRADGSVMIKTGNAE